MTKVQPSFLQTPIWAQFQASIKRQTIDKSVKEFHYMAIVEHGKLGNRLFCPYGPTVESKAGLALALDDLRREARARRLDFVRVEPRGNVTERDLRDLGLQRSHHDVHPADTLISDVSLDPDAIRAQLSQTARRYARKADQAGVTYRVSYEPTDIKYFIDMIHDVAHRTGMRPLSDFYFQHIAATLFPVQAGGLLFAELNGQKIAAIIFYTDGTTMSYAHAANDSEYRKISPATGLALHALLFAHNQGCQWFDWYGVAPPGADKSHRWAGFTQFKQSFGGRPVSSLGTWELPVRRGRYAAYKLALRLAGKAK
jgi:lipid II:glycine glycyltransferase (peptidoglycan interpeptide bridge formation enzyme)